MNLKRTAFYVMAIMLITINAFAGMDPVGWSLSPASGFPVTQVRDRSVIEYILTNRIPRSALITDEYSISGGDFDIIDNCKNTTLSYLESCSIQVAFVPKASGVSTFKLTYGYHNNVIPLPSLSAVATSGPESALKGQIIGLPPSFTQTDQPSFNTVYINSGDVDLTNCTASAYTTSGTSSATVSMPNPPANCNGTLPAHSSCTLTDNTISATPGTLSVTGHFSCTGPSSISAAPKASAIVKSSGGCTVHGYPVLPLPINTNTYSDHLVKFKFENECGHPITLGQVQFTATLSKGGSVTVTPSATYDSCSNQLLTTDCTVMASVIPLGTGNLSVQASVTSGSSTTKSTSTSTVTTPSYTHTIKFINQCPFNVWYGVENASSDKKKDPTSNPTPAQYLVRQQVTGQAPLSKSITIPGDYSGEFFPRTGCSIVGNQFICQSGDCDSNSTTGQCGTSGGSGDAHSPFTRIEEVFFSTKNPRGFYQGTYDIGLINGVSIPVEFKGLGPFTSVAPGPASFTFCTAPGAPIQPATIPSVSPNNGTPVIGNCSWNLTPPGGEEPYFKFVTKNNEVANCNAGCTVPGEECGLAFTDSPPLTALTTACGKLIGYWTIDQSATPGWTYTGLNPQTHFLTQTPVNGYGSSVTFYNFYSCTPTDTGDLESCYNPGATSKCCGAKNWNDSPYLTAQTAQYVNSNIDWTTTNLLTAMAPLTAVQWIKNACPSSYVYPWDDHSATFNCNSSTANQQKNVKMDFEVVFCPGGITGELSLYP